MFIPKKDHHAAAAKHQARLLNQPGAQDYVWTLNGQPAKRVALWCFEAMTLRLRAMVKEDRDRFRRMRRLLVKIGRLTATLDTEARAVNGFPCAPDMPKDLERFLTAVKVLWPASNEALAAIPPSVKQVETNPSIASAPTPQTFNRALVDRLKSLGFPVHGAPLAHLSVGIGLEDLAEGDEFHQVTRKRWDALTRRKRKPSRKRSR